MSYPLSHTFFAILLLGGVLSSSLSSTSSCSLFLKSSIIASPAAARYRYLSLFCNDSVSGIQHVVSSAGSPGMKPGRDRPPFMSWQEWQEIGILWAVHKVFWTLGEQCVTYALICHAISHQYGPLCTHIMQTVYNLCMNSAWTVHQQRALDASQSSAWHALPRPFCNTACQKIMQVSDSTFNLIESIQSTNKCSMIISFFDKVKKLWGKQKNFSISHNLLKRRIFLQGHYGNVYYLRIGFKLRGLINFFFVLSFIK